jgi:FlaA1/EpsC-like NDP-sugar epimerase
MEGDVGGNVFTIIALVTVLTMVLTPFITGDRVLWRLLRWHPGRQDTPPLDISNHVVLLGTGTTGMPLLETLLSSGSEVVVVDDDPAVISRFRGADVLAIRGDASDTHVLEQAGAARARVVSSTIRRPRDNRRLLEYARGIPVLVRVFEDADRRWIEEMGGTPIVYSNAAAEGLLRWYDAEKENLERALEARVKHAGQGPDSQIQ